MVYYLDTPELAKVINGRLNPNDVVLLSDKGFVIIDRDGWDYVLKEWYKFTGYASHLRLGYTDWYLIAYDANQDGCQTICDFTAFKKFADAAKVWNYVLVPTSCNLVDSFIDNENTPTQFFVQVLDN